MTQTSFHPSFQKILIYICLGAAHWSSEQIKPPTWSSYQRCTSRTFLFNALIPLWKINAACLLLLSTRTQDYHITYHIPLHTLWRFPNHGFHYRWPTATCRTHYPTPAYPITLINIHLIPLIIHIVRNLYFIISFFIF